MVPRTACNREPRATVCCWVSATDLSFQLIVMGRLGGAFNARVGRTADGSRRIGSRTVQVRGSICEVKGARAAAAQVTLLQASSGTRARSAVACTASGPIVGVMTPVALKRSVEGKSGVGPILSLECIAEARLASSIARQRAQTSPWSCWRGRRRILAIAEHALRRSRMTPP